MAFVVPGNPVLARAAIGPPAGSFRSFRPVRRRAGGAMLGAAMGSRLAAGARVRRLPPAGFGDRGSGVGAVFGNIAKVAGGLIPGLGHLGWSLARNTLVGSPVSVVVRSALQRDPSVLVELPESMVLGGEGAATVRAAQRVLPRLGGVSAAARTPGATAQAVLEEAARSAPASAGAVESAWRTLQRFRHPSVYPRLYREGTLGYALLEDVANAAIIGGAVSAAVRGAGGLAAQRAAALEARAAAADAAATEARMAAGQVAREADIAAIESNMAAESAQRLGAAGDTLAAEAQQMRAGSGGSEVARLRAQEQALEQQARVSQAQAARFRAAASRYQTAARAGGRAGRLMGRGAEGMMRVADAPFLPYRAAARGVGLLRRIPAVSSAMARAEAALRGRAASAATRMRARTMIERGIEARDVAGAQIAEHARAQEALLSGEDPVLRGAAQQELEARGPQPLPERIRQWRARTGGTDLDAYTANLEQQVQALVGTGVADRLLSAWKRAGELVDALDEGDPTRAEVQRLRDVLVETLQSQGYHRAAIERAFDVVDTTVADEATVALRQRVEAALEEARAAAGPMREAYLQRSGERRETITPEQVERASWNVYGTDVDPYQVRQITAREARLQERINRRAEKIRERIEKLREKRTISPEQLRNPQEMYRRALDAAVSVAQTVVDNKSQWLDALAASPNKRLARLAKQIRDGKITDPEAVMRLADLIAQERNAPKSAAMEAMVALLPPEVRELGVPLPAVARSAAEARAAGAEGVLAYLSRELPESQRRVVASSERAAAAEARVVQAVERTTRLFDRALQGARRVERLLERARRKRGGGESLETADVPAGTRRRVRAELRREITSLRRDLKKQLLGLLEDEINRWEDVAGSLPRFGQWANSALEMEVVNNYPMLFQRIAERETGRTGRSAADMYLRWMRRQYREQRLRGGWIPPLAERRRGGISWRQVADWRRNPTVEPHPGGAWGIDEAEAWLSETMAGPTHMAPSGSLFLQWADRMESLLRHRDAIRHSSISRGFLNVDFRDLALQLMEDVTAAPILRELEDLAANPALLEMLQGDVPGAVDRTYRLLLEPPPEEVFSPDVGDYVTHEVPSLTEKNAQQVRAALESDIEREINLGDTSRPAREALPPDLRALYDSEVAQYQADVAARGEQIAAQQAERRLMERAAQAGRRAGEAEGRAAEATRQMERQAGHLERAWEQAQKLPAERAKRVARESGAVFRYGVKAGRAAEYEQQLLRQLGLLGRQAARVHDAALSQLERLERSVEAAPARYRPAMRATQEAHARLVELEGLMEELGVDESARDIISTVAAEIPQTLSEIVGMDGDPVHWVSTRVEESRLRGPASVVMRDRPEEIAVASARRRRAGGVSGAVRLPHERTTASVRLRRGALPSVTVEGRSRALEAEATTHIQNQAAHMLAAAQGTTIDRELGLNLAEAVEVLRREAESDPALREHVEAALTVGGNERLSLYDAPWVTRPGLLPPDVLTRAESDAWAHRAYEEFGAERNTWPIDELERIRAEVLDESRGPGWQVRWERQRQVVEEHPVRRLLEDRGWREIGRTGKFLPPELASEERVLAEMQQRGLVPWDPARPVGMPSRITDDTIFMPKPTIDAYERYVFPRDLNPLLRGLNAVTSVFKASVLALTFRWHVGNILGNAFMAQVGLGMDPGEYARRITQAHGLLTDGLDQMAGEGRLRGMSDNVVRLLGDEQHGPATLIHRGWASSELGRGTQQHYGRALLPAGLRDAPGLVGRLRRGAAYLGQWARHPVKVSYEFNGWVDDINRLAVFLAAADRPIPAGQMVELRRQYADVLVPEEYHRAVADAEIDLAQAATRPEVGSATRRLERARARLEEQRAKVLEGVTDDEIAREGAIRLSLKIAGDFTRLTPFERNVLRTIFPFYPWMRHITRLTGNLVRHHPLRVAWLLHLSQLGGVQRSDYTWLDGAVPLAPDWYLLLPNINPFADVGGFVGLEEGRFDPSRVLQQVNPVLTGAYALAVGGDLPSGQPLRMPPGYYDVDAFGRRTATPLIGRPREALWAVGGRLIPQIPAVLEALDAVRGRPAVVRYQTGEPILSGGKPIVRQTRFLPAGLRPAARLAGLPTVERIPASEMSRIRARRLEERARARARYQQGGRRRVLPPQPPYAATGR